MLESVLGTFASSSSCANSHLGEVSGKQEYSYNNTKAGEVRSFPCQCQHQQFGCHFCRVVMAAEGPLGTILNSSWN